MSLAVTGAVLDGQAVGLRAEEGLIAELAPSVEAQVGDEVIDGDGLLLCPPMVNAHTHGAMTLFRGFGDDMALMEWLKTRIWPAEAKLEPENVYWGTRLACVEMIRAGTTRFFDTVGGLFPYPSASRAGVRIGLGTDGVSSNSNLDSFEEVKLLGLSQKHASGDHATLPAAEALAIARGLRSPALGATRLAVGEPADFLLLRGSDPELSAGDLDADLVYSASGSVVDTAVVAGEVLMRDRQVPGAGETVAEVRSRAARLTAR